MHKKLLALFGELSSDIHSGLSKKKVSVNSKGDATKYFDKYLEVILRVTQHKNTNKKIIIDFEKKLSDLNPECKQQISTAISEGLNAR